MTATEFQTEDYYDHITIGGVMYSGMSGPSNVLLAAGETFTWFSDYTMENRGFVICSSIVPPLPPTPPPAPPPLPPPPAA